MSETFKIHLAPHSNVMAVTDGYISKYIQILEMLIRMYERASFRYQIDRVPVSI
jgi:hypothetical protein